MRDTCNPFAEKSTRITAAMYPPMASPTSPADEEMADLNILRSTASVAEIQKPSKVITSVDVDVLVGRPLSGANQLPKATDTLRNNIDLKNDTTKKRTSLHIDNGTANGAIDPDTINIDDIVTTPCIVSDRTKFHMKRNSRALDNIVHGDNNNGLSSGSSSSNSNRASSSASGSSGDEKSHRNGAALSDVDNRKVRRVRTRASNGHRDASGNGHDDDDDDYHDLDNGNTTSDSGGNRDSVTSKGTSSDDYFLCEKFKNSLNAQFSDSVGVQAVDPNAAGEPMELLSPQEVELGRRYAEIAQFKNNNNNNKW